jgi:hypothetical protein
MNADQAAHYIGLSPSKMRTKDIPCKVDGGNKLYERADLDAYVDGLPYEGYPEFDGGGICNEADEAFGGLQN